MNNRPGRASMLPRERVEAALRFTAPDIIPVEYHPSPAGSHEHAIWPQLNAYNGGELAQFCRQSKIAIALHPDRGDLMIRSTPDQVRRAVHELTETFQMPSGGAWLYVEVDSGLPFNNVKALIETIGELRGYRR